MPPGRPEVDPSTAIQADGCFREEPHVPGGVHCQGRDEHEIDIVGHQPGGRQESGKPFGLLAINTARRVPGLQEFLELREIVRHARIHQYPALLVLYEDDVIVKVDVLRQPVVPVDGNRRTVLSAALEHPDPIGFGG
jgi:hypothetical protein